MSRHQVRLLLVAGVTLGLMVASMFVMPWFKLGAEGLDLGGLGGKLEIDLRSVRVCAIDGTCVSVSMPIRGVFPTLAAVAFWSNCVLAIVVAYQAGTRAFRGAAGEGLTRIGYLMSVLCLLSAGSAGFLFEPAPELVTLVRTWAPAMLVIADVLAMVVLHLSVAETFDTAHVASIPRVPSSPIPRVGSSQIPRVGSSPIPLGGTAPIPGGSFPIPRPGVSNPHAPATESASRPSASSFKPRSSSIPLDDAETSQADRTPATVPERPRTKAPSSVPFVTDDDPPAAVVLDPGLAGMDARPPAPLVSDVVDKPVAAAVKPRPKLSFAVERATLSASGISATRESGDVRQVAWTDIVGVVARRLPADAPYDGDTFVDVVSTAGSTLRVLPWTQLDDELVSVGDTRNGEERARALVQLVAQRCPDAKLDGATRTFLGGRGHAAQLPSTDTLAQHDARLA